MSQLFHVRPSGQEATVYTTGEAPPETAPNKANTMALHSTLDPWIQVRQENRQARAISPQLLDNATLCWHKSKPDSR